jgi:hypothetical protein
MTAGTVQLGAPGPAAAQDSVAAAKVAGLLVGALLLVGVLLGLVWQAWSPPGPLGAVQQAGIQADESEAWAASDARFALIVGVVGLLAGVAAWYVRRARGPLVLLSLTAGGLGGAALTDCVGNLVRGPGATYSCGSETGRCVMHLPLSVHMPALLLLEALLAVLVYGLFVAFAVHDDLGRPDPVRARLSVRAGGDPDDGRRDGDRAGPFEQGGLPPQ